MVHALLERHGRTYAHEIGFDPASGWPSDLFRLLTASLLFSARISADIAVRGAGLTEAGEFARLAAAFVRSAQAGDADEVLAVAGNAGDGGRAGGSGDGATKAELYEQAQRLDIPGRSRMTKSELAEAVQRA